MARPIISNRYLQFETFPSHVRGPNYTRPVFDEYGPNGNYQLAPIFNIGGRGLAGLETVSTKTWLIGAGVVVAALVAWKVMSK